MRRSIAASVFLLSVLAHGAARAEDAPAIKAPAIEIMRNGARPTGTPEAHFTGAVRLDPLQAPHGASHVSVGNVTFAPGARSDWHTHPAGQILIVTSGVGWVQQEGQPVEEMRPGDVVWIPPGVKHWHGASATNGMTHIAIQEFVSNRNVDWMEPVSAEQYHR